MEPVPLPGAPFSHYYAQDSSDEGIIMETDVAVKQVGESKMKKKIVLMVFDWTSKNIGT